MERFWEIEVEQEDDQSVEEFFMKTTVRNEDGSYTVQIPFKDEIPILGDSKGRAMARFLQNERKLEKNPERLELYNSTLREYLQLGHMRLVTNQSLGKYYIPHQAVIKEDSVTTPLRVVFDASSRSSNGKSLNEIQHVGPRLQQDLQMMLLKFRKHKIAVVSDITKMYRQIKMAEKDIPYQRVLWRDGIHGPIQEYELTTVTFGLAAAPYLAIRTLLKLASDEEKNFPQGAKLIRNNFYVDDLLASFASVEQAQQAVESLVKLTHAGHFKLRKWATSNPEALKNIDSKDLLSEMEVNLSEDKSDAIKALGVKWTPNTDKLHINIQMNEEPTVTKRKAMSVSAKIFDPLGILAPATVVFKMLIQDIWKTDLGWDENVPNQIAAKWATMQNELLILETIRVPRWIRYEPNVKHALIGFSDASEKAYGAVLYFKSGDQVTLIAARTKVAPIKRPATLPRLELLGALLLADLNAKTMEALDLNTNETEILAFSDSQITLAWIQGDHNRWKKFVSTRTNKIVSKIPRQKWFYVDTKDNPADHVSRGLSPSELVNCSLWWNGPEFLRGSVNIPTNVYNTNLETKNMNKEMVHVAFTKEKQENDTLKEIIEYHSSWFRMVRVLSWCARALSKNKPKLLRLERAELVKAETCLIKYVQKQEFPQELATLQKGNAVSGGNLANYNVMLDEKGLIRVGGRLNHATIPHDEKYPIVLPKVSGTTAVEHSLTVCIIEWAHTQTLHGGVGLTTTYLRQKYLIMGMRNSIKYCLHRCHICRRFKTEMLKQQMGTLPKDRVTMAPPFANCSVDYAGPFMVKSSGIRGAKKYKCYISVFVCLATKAYHLELVSALTALAFVQAFKRFIGRRGLVKMIRSDNGGNFVKGNKVLNKEMKVAIKEGQELAIESFVGKGLEWKFMPPLAPHFGGLHEAAVKSVKNHLKKTIGDVCLTYEDFATVLIQIEAQINSRPLITNQIDGMILTPAHFLIGRTMNTMPEPKYVDVPPTNRYRLQQQLQQRFWETWHKEYLHQLQQRPKWTVKTKNLEVNQLVLLKNELAPPTQWKKGVVVETHPGKDGLVRVVSVKDEEGNKYKRELNKVIVLPVAPFILGGEKPVVPEGYRKLPPRQHQNADPKPPAKPLRRSPRNVRSNLTTKLWSPWKAFMIMMTLAVLMVKPIGGENITVHDLPRDGILFSHQTSLLLKNGFAEIHIPTNMKHTEQRDDIQEAVLIMGDSCLHLKSEEMPLEECKRALKEVQKKAEMLKKIIEVAKGNPGKTTNLNRTKRSNGVLTWLWKFLIGTDEEQEQTDRSRKTAAVVQHSMQAFESIEIELQARQDVLKTQATQLREVVGTMTGTFQTINKATIELQVEMLKTKILHHLEMIQNNYNMIMNPQWEEQEMTEAIEKTRKDLGVQHDIPVLSVQQLRKLSTMKLIENNGSLELVITVPTVQRQIFEEFDMWPIPDLVNKTIIDLETKTIAINHLEKLYFYPTASDKRYNINGSVALIEKTLVHVAIAGKDCVVDAVFQTATNKRSCTTQKLSNKFDEWHQLPAENQYAFYTAYPTEAAQVCKNSRIPINKVKGIIIVAPGCQVITREHRIFSKHAEKLIKGYSFQIEVITEKPLHPELLKSFGKSHSESLPPVHVGELMAAAKEANELALALQDKSQFWVTMGVAGVTLLMMLVIVISIMCRRLPQQQSNHNDIEMAPMSSRVTNKPSPATRVW